MQRLKGILLVILTSLSVACGGGGIGDSHESVTINFSYLVTPVVARFKYYETSPVTVADSPNSLVFSIDTGAGNLPPGVRLDTGNGVVSGVPTNPGKYTTQIKVNVRGYKGSAEVFYNQTVVDLQLATGGDQTWAAGSSFVLYSASLEAAGDIVKSDTAHGVKVVYKMAPGSKLPAGLILDSETGLVTGFSNVKTGVYPNIFYQAIITYQGLSYTYNAPAVTYTVTGSV